MPRAGMTENSLGAEAALPKPAGPCASAPGPSVRRQEKFSGIALVLVSTKSLTDLRGARGVRQNSQPNCELAVNRSAGTWAD